MFLQYVDKGKNEGEVLIKKKTFFFLPNLYEYVYMYMYICIMS